MRILGPSPRTTEGNTTEWKQVTRGGGGEREERREKEGARQGDRELKEAPYKTWDTGLWGPCPGAPSHSFVPLIVSLFKTTFLFISAESFSSPSFSS